MYQEGQKVKVGNLDSSFQHERYLKYVGKIGIITKNSYGGTVQIKFDCDGLVERYFNYEIEAVESNKEPKDWL
jgi:ribosomal protein L21E